jgi:hypothetical protein
MVDYRLELYGIRNSGCLISHLVTEDGIRPAVAVTQPADPKAKVAIPALPQQIVEQFAEMSKRAAREEAVARFEDYKTDHAGFVEQEVERLTRMFDSRRGLLDDRIARNTRQIDHLRRFGTERQQSILPAIRGQIDADRARLQDLDTESRKRLDALHATLPEHYLRLLGATIIVRQGKLREMAT